MPLLLYLGLSFSAEAANHLGTSGELNWECELDIYGKIRKLKGDRSLIPFRFPGQYEDGGIGLYYNRFRYFDSWSGGYVSQDPIGLGGGKNFHAYVFDSNSWIDLFGLSGTHGHHSDPKFMGGDPKQPLTTMNQADHVQLHRDMNAHLETKTKVINGETKSMRPKRGNSGAKIRRNFTRTERLDALAEFY